MSFRALEVIWSLVFNTNNAVTSNVDHHGYYSY